MSYSDFVISHTRTLARTHTQSILELPCSPKWGAGGGVTRAEFYGEKDGTGVVIYLVKKSLRVGAENPRP